MQIPYKKEPKRKGSVNALIYYDEFRPVHKCLQTAASAC